jgi:hypothetical protein
MSEPSEPKQLRFFAKMPESMQVEVFELMIQSYHTLKQKNSNANRASLYRKALFSVLEKYEKKLNIGSAKKHTKELDSLLEKSNLRSKMMNVSSKRGAKKREKLLKVFAPLIVRLKEQEHRSFAWIQAYLAKYHKIKIDHTYLCKLYPRILENCEYEKVHNSEKSNLETNSDIKNKKGSEDV